MRPHPRAPKKHLYFDNPEAFPIEVRARLAAIKATRELIDKQESLFKGLPSFAPLLNQLDELRHEVDEIADYIQTYLEGGGKPDLITLEFEMTHVRATGLETTLDSGSVNFIGSDDASPSEEQLSEDVREVMQRVWDAMREQGYRLYTAMIRA